jgi:hypothetical protein
LLHPGKAPNAVWPDRPSASQLLFDAECTDSPGGPVLKSPNPTVVDGVVIQLVGATPAGASRRGWTGNRCAFEVRAADGSERHPMPLDVEGRDQVIVGRLRAIPGRERAFACFLTSDNLRKGAALNAIQVAAAADPDWFGALVPPSR